MDPDTSEFLDGYDRWYKNLPSPGGAAEMKKLKGDKMITKKDLCFINDIEDAIKNETYDELEEKYGTDFWDSIERLLAIIKQLKQDKKELEHALKTTAEVLHNTSLRQEQRIKELEKEARRRNGLRN